jgi:hypothetical protein
VVVPDFYEQDKLRDGAFQLLLRHRTTKNIIALLRPVDATAEGFSLKVNHSYAPVVQFMAEVR